MAKRRVEMESEFADCPFSIIFHGRILLYASDGTQSNKDILVTPIGGQGKIMKSNRTRYLQDSKVELFVLTGGPTWGSNCESFMSNARAHVKIEFSFLDP